MEPLDTRRRVETPEGVDFSLDLAGPVPRISAAAVDLVIRLCIYMAMGTPLALLGDTGVGIMLIAMFLLEWGYPIAFELFADGRTPGKMMMGLQTVMADGTEVTWAASVLRNVVRFADFLPMLWFAGIVSMALNRDFQRFGDMAAGTVVVHRERKSRRERAPLPDVPARAAPRPLTIDEQRAIVRFATRSVRWNAERSEELAEIVSVLAPNESKSGRVRALQGIATGIAGKETKK